MSNFHHVQFISWELYTGPCKDLAHPERSTYAGLRSDTTDHRTDVASQCRDIEARLAFIADALEQAHALADPSPQTLKIFMAPEFLCRGAGGAYLHDLLNGWVGAAPSNFCLSTPFDHAWPGLFGGMQRIAAQAQYADYLLVFGSAVSASFPTALSSNGRYELDPSQPGEVYNTTLIQRGGAEHRSSCYAARKQYVSGIDFLKWCGDALHHTNHTVVPADPESVIPKDVLGVTEGGARFTLPSIQHADGSLIDFGIEICLDHAYSGGCRRNEFGRLRTANQSVTIQLVPSGGMVLNPDSIRLLPEAGPTPYSYAFNCDGYTSLDFRVFGSHTQIWNGANGDEVPVENRLIEVGGGDPFPGTQLRRVATECTTHFGPVLAEQLWKSSAEAKGAGYVRVMQVMPLKPLS
ncbi:hypothetical protein [Undibacterium fentianense]|uniref:Uncharacterized protein n=1 Tax=Undibacterium fentianense TaxID=2828728 RepID=A0A941E312_9BURK|nr:hypothetical protein [Undibacterium fentianense]MBR7801430.1 hypothetical protein [Undibacterium fentianense]